jgi:hypothetical protein
MLPTQRFELYFCISLSRDEVECSLSSVMFSGNSGPFLTILNEALMH